MKAASGARACCISEFLSAVRLVAIGAAARPAIWSGDVVGKGVAERHAGAPQSRDDVERTPSG